MAMTVGEDHPADIYVRVHVFEEGNPPRELAYYSLRHRHGDPPGRVTLDEDGTRIIGFDEDNLWRAFARATPLSVACDAEGYLVRSNDACSGVTLSLARWMAGERERIRVLVLTQRIYHFTALIGDKHGPSGP
jgi:hypothetical protein